MSVIKNLVFIATEITALACMIKMTSLKKDTDMRTVIQYAALSIYFLLSAVILKM